MLLGPRSIAVSHRVVLCIAQFPGGSVGPVRVVRETEACSLSPDDSVLGGNARYTPLRRDAMNALRKRSTATGIPLSPSAPSARQTHSGSDCVPVVRKNFVGGQFDAYSRTLKACQFVHSGGLRNTGDPCARSSLSTVACNPLPYPY